MKLNLPIKGKSTDNVTLFFLFFPHFFFRIMSTHAQLRGPMRARHRTEQKRTGSEPGHSIGTCGRYSIDYRYVLRSFVLASRNDMHLALVVPLFYFLLVVSSVEDSEFYKKPASKTTTVAPSPQVHPLSRYFVCEEAVFITNHFKQR
jgi:hypothetical protein